MNKVLLRCVSALMLIFCVFIVPVSANSVHIDSEPSNFQYIEIDNIQYLPVRGIAEKLGYIVFWNDINQTICISKSNECKNSLGRNDVIIFSADSPGITVWQKMSNSFEKIDTLGSKSIVIDGTTYMSAYYFLRALDLTNSTTDGNLYIYTVDFKNELFENK